MSPPSPPRLDNSMPRATPTDLTTALDDPMPHIETPNHISRGPLKPDIFPHVIAQLDLDLDLDTLLVCQRVSEIGWDLVTKKLYREVTIQDWSKFVRVPDNLDLAALVRGGLTDATKIVAAVSVHEGSLIRRIRAFACVRSMTMHAFPQQEFDHMRDLLYGMALRLQDFSADDPIDTTASMGRPSLALFSCLKALRVSGDALAMDASGFESMVTYLLDLPALSHICIALPQVFSFGPGPPSDDDRSHVSAASQTLIYLLNCRDHPVEVYYHHPQLLGDDKDRVLLAPLATRNAHHILYSMTATGISSSMDINVLNRRALQYLNLLRLASRAQNNERGREGDSSDETNPGHGAGSSEASLSISKTRTDGGPCNAKPRATWTISGEMLPLDDPYRADTARPPSLRALVSLMQVYSQLLDADGDIDVSSFAEELTYIDTEEEAGTERLRFRLPGYEEVCPVCGCS